MNDSDELLTLLTEQPGITEEWRSIVDILKAMGRPVTLHTRVVLRDKMRPLIEAGKIESRPGYSTRIDGARVRVPLYRKVPTTT